MCLSREWCSLNPFSRSAPPRLTARQFRFLSNNLLRNITFSLFHCWINRVFYLALLCIVLVAITCISNLVVLIGIYLAFFSLANSILDASFGFVHYQPMVAIVHQQFCVHNVYCDNHVSCVCPTSLFNLDASLWSIQSHCSKNFLCRLSSRQCIVQLAFARVSFY